MVSESKIWHESNKFEENIIIIFIMMILEIVGKRNLKICNTDGGVKL